MRGCVCVYAYIYIHTYPSVWCTNTHIRTYTHTHTGHRLRQLLETSRVLGPCRQPRESLVLQVKALATLNVFSQIIAGPMLAIGQVRHTMCVCVCVCVSRVGQVIWHDVAKAGGLLPPSLTHSHDAYIHVGTGVHGAGGACDISQVVISHIRGAAHRSVDSIKGLFWYFGKQKVKCFFCIWLCVMRVTFFLPYSYHVLILCIAYHVLNWFWHQLMTLFSQSRVFLKVGWLLAQFSWVHANVVCYIHATHGYMQTCHAWVHANVICYMHKRTGLDLTTRRCLCEKSCCRISLPHRTRRARSVSPCLCCRSSTCTFVCLRIYMYVCVCVYNAFIQMYTRCTTLSLSCITCTSSRRAASSMFKHLFLCSVRDVSVCKPYQCVSRISV